MTNGQFLSGESTLNTGISCCSSVMMMMTTMMMLMIMMWTIVRHT